MTEASSASYSLHGMLGEQAGTADSQSDSYQVGPGIIFTEQANIPPAPTFTNPGSTYDRLKIVINTGGNPNDAEYAVAITTDNWTTTRFIQNDLTIGNSLGNEDFLDYTAWGGAGGEFITNLAADTNYTVKVKARQGNFTESAWGPIASASTSVPSLTFTVSGDAVIFDALTSANSWTDSSKSTTLTTSTNAYNGYTVFAHENRPLTNQYDVEIPDYSSPNSAPTNWTGTGFGYTTEDSILAGGTANRFTDNGPNYAGFVTSLPGDPVADNTGPIIETPISNESFNISYRVTGNEQIRAGSYQNTVIYIIVPTY